MAGPLRRLYWARYRARKRGEVPPPLPSSAVSLNRKPARPLGRLYSQRCRARKRGLELPPLPERPALTSTENQRALRRLYKQRSQAKRLGLELPPLPERPAPLLEPKKRTPEQRRRWNRAYGQKHKEKECSRKKQQRLNPKVLARERVASRQWRLAHPEKAAARDASRRAREKNAPIIDLTDAQWEEMQIAFEHRCAYCGKRRKGKLTQDHVTPYANNGSHTLWNVVPACAACNSKKGKKPPLLPVQPLLLTLALPKPRKQRGFSEKG